MKSKMNLSMAAAFGGAIAASVTGAHPALAQTTKNAQIEEIVVTANRREENMQKVPIAVTAFSTSSLKQRGVTSTNDLSSAVPGLTFTHNGNYATPFLRGVGNAATGPEAESSVAIYIDGVYQLEESSDLFKFNNVQRIEVLKGPQGTLFGRNATGGVIQVITKDPSSTPHADVEVGYGNYDTFTGSLYATTGIAKNLAADIAIQGDNQSGGWGRNTSTGGPSFTGSDLSLRSKWLWKPDDDTRVTLALNASRSTGGPGYDWSLLPGSKSLLGTYDTQGFYDVNENYEGKNDPIVSSEEGASLKIEHDFDWARGISITSFQTERSHDGLDQDTEGPEIVDVGIYTGADAYTQEFQLQSNKQSKISWVGGVFFLHDDPNLHLFVSGQAFPPPGPTDEQVFAHEIVNSAAAYGQATAEILPDTHLTIGLRYTTQHNEVRGYSEIPGFILPGSTAAGGVSQNTSATQSASFEKLTYRFALDHNFTPDILGYVSYNRGFKAGLFNLNNPANPPVKPEVLDAYELGVKNELFDHRLRLNAATFYYQYKEIQVTSISLGSQTFYNGAAATLYGLDADFTFAATDNLTVSGGLEAMHGTYTNFPGAVSYVPGPAGDQLQPGAPNGINATGNPTVRTPNYSANLAADYVYPLEHGNLEGNLSWSYTGGYTWDPNARLRQPSVNLVNGSVAWIPNETWSVRLWAENILNKRYYAYEGAQSSGDTFSPAAPATYGVTIGAHF